MRRAEQIKTKFSLLLEIGWPASVDSGSLATLLTYTELTPQIRCHI